MSLSEARTTLLRGALMVGLLVATALIGWIRLPAPRAPGEFAPLPEEPARLPASFGASFVTRGDTREVHSATAAALPGGGLIAFWYGGSREGAGDVAIYSAAYDQRTRTWGAPRLVIDREGTARDLGRYVRKLGNPVVFRPDGDTLWLFFVSVSVGGWAGSAINVMVSDDLGESWGRSRRLITSPFLNLSTLVKGPAIRFADGTVGLPVYHEFIGKFGELLLLDAKARVVGKTRLSRGGYSLQPVIVPVTRKRAVGLMRYAGAPPSRVLEFASDDGGISWSPPEKSSLANPNAAVGAVRLPDGELLVAFNDSEEERDNLRLARSIDAGRSWQIVFTVEPDRDARPEKDPQFSYPWLMRGTDGMIHLLYTWHKREIKHVHFSVAWLASRQPRDGEPLR